MMKRCNMRSRLSLHETLVSLVDDKTKVYFQPEENIRMTYPCIVYNEDGSNINYADNKSFDIRRRYNIIYMTKKPDPETLISQILSLKGASYDSSFISEGVYHYYFTVFN